MKVFVKKSRGLWLIQSSVFQHMMRVNRYDGMPEEMRVDGLESGKSRVN